MRMTRKLKDAPFFICGVKLTHENAENIGRANCGAVRSGSIEKKIDDIVANPLDRKFDYSCGMAVKFQFIAPAVLASMLEFDAPAVGHVVEHGAIE